ncbi:MAG TPA: FAD-dependent oxidoreductase, partial [Anaerolineales bacterium]|nr:FAD-dependent oxidoreductase [Anaerolineales bacterium]
MWRCGCPLRCWAATSWLEKGSIGATRFVARFKRRNAGKWLPRIELGRQNPDESPQNKKQTGGYERMKIAIIGAGFGGMAAAYDLRKAGHEVTIFEAADHVGGLASGFKAPGWKWTVEKFYH